MDSSAVPRISQNRDVETMAAFYTGLVPGSRIIKIVRSPADHASGMVGYLLTASFTLAGRSFFARNGGLRFGLTKVISLPVDCDDEAEVNRPLPDTCHRATCWWFWLGWPAFISVVAIFWLMVAKPM